VRFGIEPLTADNGYFKYAVELGIQGLAALLAIFAGILGVSFKLARYGSTHSRRLMGTVVLFTTIGVMLNATTGVVFNALVLSYLYFWFAGAVVTVAQKEFDAQPAAESRLELSPA
jgi:O-antigen ligase